MGYRVVEYMANHESRVVPTEEIANETGMALSNVSACLSHASRSKPIHPVVRQIPEARGFWYYGPELPIEEIKLQLEKYF